MKKIIFSPGLLFMITSLLISVSNVHAVDFWPMQVGSVYEYAKHDSATPQNNWTVQAEVLNTVTIGSYDYFNVKITELGVSDNVLFRSTADTIFYYGGGVERPFWKSAPVGTTWSYLDPDGVGTAFAEIVSVDTLPWETDKNTLTVPYNSYSFSDVYIHKKYYNTPDNFWYEYVVPGVGVVKDVDFGADNNPPHITELSQIRVVPEPVSSTLFLVGAATLGFRRFRKRELSSR